VCLKTCETQAQFNISFHQGNYWLIGTPAEAKAKCQSMPLDCKQFEHQHDFSESSLGILLQRWTCCWFSKMPICRSNCDGFTYYKSGEWSCGVSRFQNKSVFSVCFFVIEITDNGSNSLLALFFVDEFQGVDKIVAVGPIWIQIGPKIRS